MSTRTTTQATTAKPRRAKEVTPFDEAKSAQARLDALETKRRAVIDGLSDEAAVLLEALDELRARQIVEVAPSEPDASE